uniref:acetyl-coenzyme A synthetase, cytoplasmic n=1 Tax=Ciona intestinalis TaxID=7719 RepID=UPI000180C3E1|nr:acetyl-coenzyme A synthetase, cytoplasmic [Ciona intestinalis]|eukprot:XP_026690167.1 acetyl-coenzyme A synthetase, cytoplasmic [Ciona intestinalis]
MADKIEKYLPPTSISEVSHVKTMDQYKEMYKQSVEEPGKFWGKIAETFYFKKQHEGEFFDYNLDIRKGEVYIRCLSDATTNICYNCLDRNVKSGHGDTIAFYWEGNDPMDSTSITYKKLLDEVCKFSNVLKSLGVKKGDRVAIYMPMILELVVAMLACARIGAVHSIVFGGFSAEALSSRILDAKCDVLVTADGVYRGTKLIDLKSIADEALELCTKDGHSVSACVVVKHITANSYCDDKTERPAMRPYSGFKMSWNKAVDRSWEDLMQSASNECEPEWMNSEDPLFILYTSGSTGIPKGVLHHVSGYMLYAATTHKYTFDYHCGEVYFCTADIGWITGHTYITYGPLLNCATSVMFEGTPLFPDASRYWAIVDKYKVSKFYTAPTAIRSLMKYGEEPIRKYSRSSLKVLGTVGEPINPEAWLFYHKVIGNESCSIVDTFWQTETGGHVLTPFPGCTPTKPGSATFPFFGIVPAILSDEGVEIEGPGEGYLVFKQPWPGMMRTVFGDHKRFERTYFTKFPGYYVPGDGCKRDEDGYIWITGRIDDMINVSGHLLSTAEVESSLIEHPQVAEAAVVSKPHSVKGECLYCFVTVLQGSEFNKELVKELKEKVRHHIGAFSTPDYIQNAPGLPKTRSGKIMRRVLRNVAKGNRDLGDVSTMADASVVEVLFQNRVE